MTLPRDHNLLERIESLEQHLASLVRVALTQRPGFDLPTPEFLVETWSESPGNYRVDTPPAAGQRAVYEIRFLDLDYTRAVGEQAISTAAGDDNPQEFAADLRTPYEFIPRGTLCIATPHPWPEAQWSIVPLTSHTALQNLFETIQVSGQSDVVADSPNDILTFAGTANQIEVTTDAGTDTVTWAIPDNPVFPGTGGIGIPGGTTAQRSGAPGNDMRYNIDLGQYEFYQNGVWTQLPGNSGPIDADYICVNLSPDLLNERKATETAFQIAFVDGGAGGNFEIYIPDDCRLDRVGLGKSAAGATNTLMFLGGTPALIASSGANEPIRISPNGTGDLELTCDITSIGSMQWITSGATDDITIGPSGNLFFDAGATSKTITHKACTDFLKGIKLNGSAVIDSRTGAGTTVVCSDSPVITTQITAPSVVSGSALALTPAAGSNVNITTSGAGNVAINGTQLVWKTSDLRLGIGTATPNRTVKIEQSGSPSLEIKDTGGTVETKLQTITTKGIVGTRSNDIFSIVTNNTDRIVTTAAGLVQIGSGVADALLDVTGGTSNRALLPLPTSAVGAASLDNSQYSIHLDETANLPKITVKNSAGTTTTRVIQGRMLQSVQASDGATASGTTLMVNDDTIPQNTEGDQFITATITPKSSTSTLVIRFQGNFSRSNDSRLIYALFKDSAADAVAVGAIRASAVDVEETVFIQHYQTSGSTSAQTFKIRAGGNIAGTTYFNGNSAGRRYGGKFLSSLVIQEYE